MNINATRRRVKAMMERFPSVHVAIVRANKDDFGQPDGTEIAVGEVDGWFEIPSKPVNWAVKEAGQTFGDDNEWLKMAWSESIPSVQYEDICVFPDNSRKVIRNIGNDVNHIIVRWQLSEV